MAESAFPPLSGIIASTVTVEAMARQHGSGDADVWEPLNVARDPAECLPGLTLCSETECVDGWLLDFHLRVLDGGRVVWTSPDAPVDAGGHAMDAVIIPFPRR